MEKVCAVSFFLMGRIQKRCNILSNIVMYIVKGGFIFLRSGKYVKYKKELLNYAKDEEKEIRLIKEKLDYYMMEADDKDFDTEDVQKLLKRLDELEPIPLPWKSVDEALKDFWKYFDERQREERIITVKQ